MKMAEGEGFEPSRHITAPNGLANRRLQPLGHPSANERLSTTTYAAGPFLAQASRLVNDMSGARSFDREGSPEVWNI